MALYFSDGRDNFCSIMKMLNFDPVGIWWGAAPENRQNSCSVIHYIIIGLGWMHRIMNLCCKALFESQSQICCF